MAARRGRGRTPGARTGRARTPGARTGRARTVGAAPNAAGAHYLNPDIAASIVADAGIGAGDLVLDLGAGWGALTAPLARAGARVIAVERDPDRVRRLARRFASRPAVRVVQADLRSVALPRQRFRVVANVPFALTAAVLHRLLDPPGSQLAGADLVLQREAARRFAAWSRAAAGAWWGVRYDLRPGRPLGPECFRPPPSVSAMVLAVRPLPLPAGAESRLAALLDRARCDPYRRIRALVTPTTLRRAGVPPATPIGALDASRWRAVITYAD